MTSPRGDVKPTTPLPWRVTVVGRDHFTGEPTECAVEDTFKMPNRIADVPDPEDAALIVRRVNGGPAADALADAVEQFSGLCVPDPANPDDYAHCEHDDCNAVKDAIRAYRKASEEPQR